METTRPDTVTRCFNCSQPVERITEQDVLKFIGDDEVPLNRLMDELGGTLTDRTQIVTWMVSRGAIELTSERTVRRRKSPYKDNGQPCGGSVCDGEQFLCTLCSDAANLSLAEREG